MPEWIARLFQVRRVRTKATKLDQPFRTWESVGSFGQRMKDVCEECNTGWMSDLENLAKPILTRLMFPRHPFRVLSQDEQLVVASWLWKTCVVFELATEARYFDASERRCLFDGPGEPPRDTVFMWLGVYVGDNIANIRGGPAQFSAPDGEKISGLVVTMTAGLMSAQVLAIRPTTRNVSVTTRRNFERGERQIWPDTAPVAWPPEVPLTTETLRLWHIRWNTPPRDE